MNKKLALALSALKCFSSQSITLLYVAYALLSACCVLLVLCWLLFRDKGHNDSLRSKWWLFLALAVKKGGQEGIFLFSLLFLLVLCRWDFSTIVIDEKSGILGIGNIVKGLGTLFACALMCPHQGVFLSDMG